MPDTCEFCSGSGTVIDPTIESAHKDVRCTACDGTGDSPEEHEQPNT